MTRSHAILVVLSGPTHFEDALHQDVEPNQGALVDIWIPAGLWTESRSFMDPKTLLWEHDQIEFGLSDEIAFEVFDD